MDACAVSRKDCDVMRNDRNGAYLGLSGTDAFRGGFSLASTLWPMNPEP